MMNNQSKPFRHLRTSIWWFGCCTARKYHLAIHLVSTYAPYRHNAFSFFFLICFHVIFIWKRHRCHYARCRFAFTTISFVYVGTCGRMYSNRFVEKDWQVTWKSLLFGGNSSVWYLLPVLSKVRGFAQTKNSAFGWYLILVYNLLNSLLRNNHIKNGWAHF